MSGRLKKIIWIILMAELVIIHLAVLGKLYIRGNKVIVYIFIIGFVLMAVFEYLGYRAFVRKCVRTISRLEDENIIKIFQEICTETGNSSDEVRIYESSEMTTPLVMGIVKPAVILPKAHKIHEYIRTILLHECFHVKRRDTQYKYGMLLANCLLWFNPLAYFIRYISYQDIEISCDEAVVNGKSREERLAYGQFLIDNVRRQNEKGNAFNAYWNSSKKILMNRIDAVVNENKKWDLLAKVAIVLLIVEVLVSAVLFGKNIMSEYHRISAPKNEYADVCSPPIYDDVAIHEMLKLKPVEPDSYNIRLFGKYDNQYPEKAFTEIEAITSSPWQIKIKRPGPFGNAADIAIQRLYFYLENQTAFDSELYENSAYYTTYELINRTFLAGDIDNSVWGYIWRVYCPDVEASTSFQKGYAFSKSDKENYLYFATAVQIKMIEPYIFEAVGYADLNKVTAEYENIYHMGYTDVIPRVEEFTPQINRDLSNQEKLAKEFSDGNGLGYVSVSFPENDSEGYLLAVADKVVMQVCCSLYKTEDSGKSWTQVEMDTVGSEHRLVYEFNFVNNQEGYMALYSFYEDSPCMLRTGDGGLTWQEVSFYEGKADFCQAFTPVLTDDGYEVYVGKEGSHKEKGEKACYESYDGGLSWNYTGQVTFD